MIQRPALKRRLFLLARASSLALAVGTPLVSSGAHAQSADTQPNTAGAGENFDLPTITVQAASPVSSATPAAAFFDQGTFSFISGAFVPVTVIGEKQIDLSPATNLADVLFTQPGITSTTFAPGASRPVIRGLDNFRVRMQEDGIDTMDVSTLGEDHAVPVDPLSTQRIEVIRGPATLRYGSQAIGGVVNAENNRIPIDLTTDGYRIDMKGAAASVDAGVDGAINIDARKGNFSFHADAFGRTASDYAIPGGGVQPNSYVRSNGQALGLTYHFDTGYIGTAFIRYASRYGIPGGEEAELRTNIDMEQLKWLTKGEFNLSDGPIQTIRFWTGLSSYRHDERGLPHAHDHDHDHDHDHGGGGDDHDHDHGHDHGHNHDHDHDHGHDHAHSHDHDHDHDHDHGHGDDDDHHDHANILPGMEYVHGTFKGRALEGRLELQHVPVTTGLGLLNGALGFQVNYENLDTTGEAEDFLAPYNTTRAAAYLFEELDLSDSLRLQAAARIETVYIDGARANIPGNYLPPPEELFTFPASRSFVPMSASLGLLQDLAFGITGRLTAQYVERAPAALELYSKGSHHATGTFDIGNPNLKKEGAKSIELGFARAQGAWRFDVSGYYTQFDGFIYKQLTGITCNESFASCGTTGGEFDQVVYDQRNATFYGVELKTQLDIGRFAEGTWGLEGQYDFVHATFSDGSYVPRLPPHRLGGGLYWGNAAFAARINYLRAFAQNDVAAYESTTPGYNLLNAEISHTRELGTYGANPVVLTVGLTGSNLLDEDIYNSASFKNEVALAGRSVRGFANIRF